MRPRRPRTRPATTTTVPRTGPHVHDRRDADRRVLAAVVTGGNGTASPRPTIEASDEPLDGRPSRTRSGGPSLTPALRRRRPRRPGSRLPRGRSRRGEDPTRRRPARIAVDGGGRDRRGGPEGVGRGASGPLERRGRSASRSWRDRGRPEDPLAPATARTPGARRHGSSASPAASWSYRPALATRTACGSAEVQGQKAKAGGLDDPGAPRPFAPLVAAPRPPSGGGRPTSRGFTPQAQGGRYSAHGEANGSVRRVGHGSGGFRRGSGNGERQRSDDEPSRAEGAEGRGGRPRGGGSPRRGVLGCLVR